MTNEARYKRAFSTLHASGNFMEVKTMNNTGKRYIPRLAAVCAAAALVLALAGGAYAADVGGVRHAVQIWLHGDLTNAALDIQGGEYTLTYTDGQGNAQERGGGGIVMEADGTERALTEGEIVEQLNSPEVEYGEDGAVTVWWRGQKLDITDKFQGKVCYVKLTDGAETVYLTVKYHGGYGWSNEDYPDPNDFYAE